MIHIFKVLDKLRTLFLEFESSPPALVIMMGNFCSGGGSSLAANVSHLRFGFEQLTDLIRGFPRLMHSHFLFIPGPTDPGGAVANILPKEPLPKSFTSYASEKLPNCFFGTNPTR
jgi:DNA polymerase epsilon subunit 2